MTFTVTMRFQYPAWDEKDGISFEIRANSKAEAIKYARSHARYEGHSGTGKGRVTFKAEIVE